MYVGKKKKKKVGSLLRRVTCGQVLFTTAQVGLTWVVKSYILFPVFIIGSKNIGEKFRKIEHYLYAWNKYLCKWKCIRDNFVKCKQGWENWIALLRQESRVMFSQFDPLRAWGVVAAVKDSFTLFAHFKSFTCPWRPSHSTSSAPADQSVVSKKGMRQVNKCLVSFYTNLILQKCFHPPSVYMTWKWYPKNLMCRCNVNSFIDTYLNC